MSTNKPYQDPQDAQTDLLATIAAGRELGPDMDRALAESYMQKHHPELISGNRASPRDVAAGTSADVGQIAHASIFALGIVAYIVLLIVSQGKLWPMFWLPMAIGGWWWRGGVRDERFERRRELREASREARYRAREARYRARAARYEGHYVPDGTVDPRGSSGSAPSRVEPPTSAASGPTTTQFETQDSERNPPSPLA